MKNQVWFAIILLPWLMREDLLPGLVLAGVIDTIDRTLDRIGPGTANVYFELNGDNFPLFQRENLFCGPDVAAVALQELGEILRVITGNEYVHPELTNVNVQVKIKPEQLKAKIVQVDLPKQEFAPGEKATLTVHLLPFRGEVVQTAFEVQLPTTPGQWLLVVYGNEYSYVPGNKGITKKNCITRNYTNPLLAWKSGWRITAPGFRTTSWWRNFCPQKGCGRRNCQKPGTRSGWRLGRKRRRMKLLLTTIKP